MFWVYILTCYDKDKKKTYYTGLTNNLERRYAEHSKGKKGAKYTRNKKVNLSYTEPQGTGKKGLIKAMQREREIKKLYHREKMLLIREHGREH